MEIQTPPPVEKSEVWTVRYVYSSRRRWSIVASKVGAAYPTKSEFCAVELPRAQQSALSAYLLPSFHELFGRSIKKVHMQTTRSDISPARPVSNTIIKPLARISQSGFAGLYEYSGE